MSKPERKITHSTFTVDRVFPHPPAKVWSAFATKEAKGKWFSGPAEWTQETWELDFRIGGKETSITKIKDGPRISFEARYYDLLPNERLVYAYEMHIDDARISVSLATIELRPEAKGTRLIITEQGAFLDGFDDPSMRERGTNELIDKLGKTLG